jgi:hypothetical protein
VIQSEEFNFIELAEHREGHGYFILPATQDFNFTVSLRIGEGHGYFILPILIVEMESIVLNKNRASSICWRSNT